MNAYSLDFRTWLFNWSQFKQFLKRAKARTVDDLLDAMARAAKTITPEHAQGYFQHAEDFSLVIT